MGNKIQKFPVHSCVGEPYLLFHPDRPEDQHQHPLLGLLRYGPYSRSLINSVIDPIRISIIAPKKDFSKAEGILAEMETRQRPVERRQYLQDFPGFSSVFGVRAVKAEKGAHVELSDNFEKDVFGSKSPHLSLAEGLSKSLAILEAKRSAFDVIFIYLPKRWNDCFIVVSDNEEFDLHDYVKAIGASRGMPIQILLEESALSYRCRCSVMWRLSLALYCKAGGVPWKLAEASQDMAFIGLSYAMRANQKRGSRYVVCCSQVFDSDGAGLQFILYETSDARIIRDNPFLTRSEMRRVMARSLELYQRQHAGQIPKRVVIHKSTEFKKDEVEGCYDAWNSVEGLELIQIQQDVIWRGVKIDMPQSKSNKKGLPSGYPCDRGVYQQISSHDALLWTQGNASSIISGGRNYYKEGKGIPSPLLLKRYAGHLKWDEQCRYVLGLTKMNWNNDGLYDRLPVTLGYATILARTVKRMSKMASRPYQLRFFM